MFSLVTQYIRRHNLQPGDVVVLNRQGIALLDHYAVYIGNNQFIANLRPGVQLIGPSELWRYLDQYAIVRVRRLENGWDRQAAVNRARDLYESGAYTNTYHLAFDNCEHFANYVQYGKRYSQQTEVACVGAAVTGAILAFDSEDEDTQTAGWLLLLGGILGALENRSRNAQNYQHPSVVRRLR